MKLANLLAMLDSQLSQRLAAEFPDLTRQLDGLAILSAPSSQASQPLILQATQQHIAPSDAVDIHLFHLLQRIGFSQPDASRGRSSRQTEVATLSGALYTTNAAVVDFVGVFLSTRPNIALVTLDFNPADVTKLLKLDRVPKSTNAGPARYFVAYTYTYRSELGGLCE